MTFEVKKSTQFKINELVVVTKAGNIDISGIYEEINIFDSIFLPVMNGKILIKDSVGLSGRLLFDGSESVLIDIAKDGNSEVASFKKAFRIFRQGDRKTEQGGEMFTLDFVSDEMMYSDQQRINQSFSGTYSYVTKKILENYLKVPENQLGGVYEDTIGIRDVAIPNLRPLEAIEWIAKRCVDINQAPNFLFYQNLTGYNFASLSTLLTEEELLDIKFEPKNTKQGNSLTEISSARAFEVISQADNLKKQREGVNAGQFIGFDPMTKTVAKKNISFGDTFTTMKHGNETPEFSEILNRDGRPNTQAFDSKKSVSIFGSAQNFSAYVKKNAPETLSKIENYETWLFQRKSIISHLMAKRLKIAMPGNFQLTSGFNVNVMAPIQGQKEQGDDNDDPSLSGKYLIVASRHIIGYDKHETVIEVATTSTSNEFIPTSNPQQIKEILEY
jgi:hypothetical protein